ncbi:EamA family transporter [Brevibacterium senegalense]|uniref:EamA family transporter n=1 Tax=Brevibacterium senegalense TaxID=1033736 RepID=UPI0011C91D6F|nr:EamA family transporter [Brevibacterium senegalense]
MHVRVVVGFVFMLASALFFAVSGPVAKALYEIGWTPGSVVLTRLSGAALIMLIPTLIALRGRWGEVRRSWRSVAAYGVVSMAGVQAFFFLAVEHLSVAIAVLLEVMGAPLIVVLWLWARTRQRPGAVTGIGVVISLIGVLLVLDFQNSSLSWFGVFMAVGAAACFAFYFLTASQQAIAIPPIAFTGLGMTAGALAVLVINLSHVMPAQFANASVDFASTRMSWFVPAVLLVVFTVGAYVCGFIGLRYLGATVGSFVNLIEVPASAVAAFILLGELLTRQQFLGGGVILVGIALVKWGDLLAQRRQEPPTRVPLHEDDADTTLVTGSGSTGSMSTADNTQVNAGKTVPPRSAST